MRDLLLGVLACLVLCAAAPCAAAETYEWKNVAIRGGGFVPGVIFSPIGRDLVYARIDMGGAYRRNPADGTWVPLTDWVDRDRFNWFGIESIAPDPVDPDTVYMACGTYMGAGNGVVMRSRDRGETWQTFEIGVPMGGNHNGRSMGERLAVDPNRNSSLYFGSRANGLLRSTDSGETWAPVESFEARGDDDLGLSLVVFDGDSGTDGGGSSAIYVGVASTAEGSNLYRTVDAGESWQLVPGGPSGMMPHHAAIATNGAMYLAYNDGPGPNGISDGMIWKLDMASGRWTDVSPPREGGGFGGITVDAANPDRIIAATLDRWSPHDEVYLSTNAGAAWTAIGSPAKRDHRGAHYLYFGRDESEPRNLSTMGWMGDIDLDPFDPGRAFYVTGQGIWLSDNTDSPEPGDVLWRFENEGLEETVPLHLPPSVNGPLLSVVGDIGGFRHTSLDEPPVAGMYSSPVFSNGNCIDFAGLNPSIVVRSGTGAQTGAYSTDNGVTWQPFPPLPEPPTADGQRGGRWRRRSGGVIAVSADGSTVLWTLNGVLSRTTDFGRTWTPCEGVSRAAIASDRVNPDKFYAFANNALLVSTDGGASFGPAWGEPGQAAPEGGRRRRQPSGRIRPVFGREGDVWFHAEGVLHHSADSGATAVRVDSVEYVNALGFGKGAPGAGYPAVYLTGRVAGVCGAFRSLDAGATWERINDDRHQFGLMDHCAGDELVFGRVYIGTHGRGIVYGQPRPDDGPAQ